MQMMLICALFKWAIWSANAYIGDAFVFFARGRSLRRLVCFHGQCFSQISAVAVEYTVLMDKQGGDFTAPITLSNYKECIDCFSISETIKSIELI
jgi:hypothetical protein